MAKKSLSPARAARPKRADNSKEEAVYRNLLEQPAQITKEQAEDIDQATLDPTSGYSQWRRCALATLTRSGSELAEAIDDAGAAAAFAEVSVHADLYVERLQSLMQMMTAASLRIQIALCKRADMQLLLEVARAKSASDLRIQ